MINSHQPKPMQISHTQQATHSALNSREINLALLTVTQAMPCPLHCSPHTTKDKHSNVPIRNSRDYYAPSHYSTTLPSYTLNNAADQTRPASLSATLITFHHLQFALPMPTVQHNSVPPHTSRDQCVLSHYCITLPSQTSLTTFDRKRPSSPRPSVDIEKVRHRDRKN
jgi:hypothetical protein